MIFYRKSNVIPIKMKVLSSNFSRSIQFSSLNLWMWFRQLRYVHQDTSSLKFPTNVKIHFKSISIKNEEFEKIPQNYKSRSKKVTNVLLADPILAKKISGVICAHLNSNNILEFDAGLGFMSEVFIQNGYHCRLYDNNVDFMKELQKKFGHAPKQIKFFPVGFHNLFGVLYGTGEDSIADYKQLTEGMTVTPWTEKIEISFIIPVMNRVPLQTLLINYIESESLRQFGRPEWFFIIPKNILKLLIRPNDESNGRHRLLGYLYNMFCDIDVLLEDMSRHSFLPWKTLKDPANAEPMCLVRIVPKYERFPPCEDEFFVKAVSVLATSLLKKNRRVISSFETYAPECGIQFIIEDNLTPYTEFFEITPEKFYSLLRKLKDYPGFQAAFMNKSQKV